MLELENRAEMLKQVAGTFGADTPSDILTVDATTRGSVQEIKVDDVKTPSADPEVEETVEVETQSTEKAETDDSHQPRGHKVPYNRFKNVLESRNQFRTEVETYKDKLTSLEQKLANLEQSKTQTPFQKPEVEKTWLDDYLAASDEVQPTSAPEWQQQYGSLNDRLYKFEVAQEEKQLQTELSDIQSVYPNVPQDVLLKAVIANPDTDMKALAERYSTFLAGIEEQAIARYTESQGGQPAVAPSETPALQRPRSSSAPRNHLAPPQKPKTVGGATKMLRDMLHKDNIFKK